MKKKFLPTTPFVQWLLLMIIFFLYVFMITPSIGQAEESFQESVSDNNKKETVQSGTETESERDKIYMKIGEVTVTGKSDFLTTADAPASVDVIGFDQIEMENVNSSMELMKKIPGTYFGNWNQGILSSSFSMRGYDVNNLAPVALSIDGIPSYYSSLNGIDLSPIFPFEIDRIELLKGTTDPRYGLNNIAGSMNVYTKQGGNYKKVRLLTGSNETYDSQVAIGFEKDNFSQNYFGGFRSTDGYRDHSDSVKGTFSGKWFYALDDYKGKVGAIVRYFNMVADAPGYISEEQAEEDPGSAAAYARTDGGNLENKHASIHFDYAFTDSLYWTIKAYTQQMERQRYVRWSLAGSQKEELIKDTQYGAVSTVTFETQYHSIKRIKVDWGVDYQFNESTAQRWLTEDRVRQGDEIRYLDNNIQSVGSYIQVDSDVRDWLRLFAALRVDSFEGDLENKITNTKTDMLDLDFIWQPKVGTVITPFQGYNFYANWGRTFQLPGIPDRYGQDFDGNLKSRNLTESQNDGWEVGIKASPFKWLSARVDIWQLVATDEVRKKEDGSGDKINIGETTRDGWDVSFSVRPHPWFSMWGSYSHVEAVYTDPGIYLQDRKGKDIELIPDYIAKLGLDLEHPNGLSSSFWLESQSDYYVLNDPENQNNKVGDYNVFNFKVAYQLQKMAVGFEIKNVFDEEYYAYAWNLDNGFQPGEGRSFYAWVNIDF